MILNWFGVQVTQEVQRQAERGMVRAMIHLEGKVIRKISKGQPPSRPGEPPHVLTGRLRQSITHQVEVVGREVIGRVGTNVEYGRRLELGFVGTDSLGRNVNQAQRPYLRPTLLEERGTCVELIAKG